MRTSSDWKGGFADSGFNRSSTDGDDPEADLNPVIYSFETSRLKGPLFGRIQSHGWNHNGFLRKFFAR